MLIDAAIISLLVGFLRKGRLRSLGDLKIHRVELILVACLLQGGCLFLAQRGIAIAVQFGPYVNILSYILLMAALWANRDQRAFRVVAVGVLLNAVVIAANGGQMPVSLTSLEQVGLGSLASLLDTGTYITHTKLTDDSVLHFLSDWLYIPGYKRARVFSIGDVVISLGVFMLIQNAMLQERSRAKGYPRKHTF
ncbi:MAG: DUF5317 domain-containing protein [Limnochordia bacterium]|nr:DUF5317 domain-containing protein [Limnochordia bacterium]